MDAQLRQARGDTLCCAGPLSAQWRAVNFRTGARAKAFPRKSVGVVTRSLLSRGRRGRSSDQFRISVHICGLPRLTTVWPPGPQDFERMKLIGQGDVGKVYLVRLKASAHYFAMKVLSKQEMIARNKVRTWECPLHLLMIDLADDELVL
jgi:hypothetical protein